MSVDTIGSEILESQLQEKDGSFMSVPMQRAFLGKIVTPMWFLWMSQDRLQDLLYHALSLDNSLSEKYPERHSALLFHHTDSYSKHIWVNADDIEAVQKYIGNTAPESHIHNFSQKILGFTVRIWDDIYDVFDMSENEISALQDIMDIIVFISISNTKTQEDIAHTIVDTTKTILQLPKGPEHAYTFISFMIENAQRVVMILSRSLEDGIDISRKSTEKKIMNLDSKNLDPYHLKMAEVIEWFDL